MNEMSQQTRTFSLGQELKRIREQRGWSLQAASKVTRIRVDQLELIEQDRLDEFPSHGYVRGFIRIYSKALGLNPDVVMDHVERRPDRKNFTNEENSFFLDFQPITPNSDAEVSLDERAQQWGSKIVAALVVLVIFGIVAVVYKSIQDSNSSSIVNSARQLTQNSKASPEETPLPLIPRERLQAQNQPTASVQNTLTTQTSPVAPRSEPQMATSQIETQIKNEFSNTKLPVVRPTKVLNIPLTNPNSTSEQQNATADQLPYTTNTTHQIEPVLPTEEKPINQSTAFNTNAPITNDTAKPNHSSAKNNITPDTATLQESQQDQLIILEETNLPEEEIALSDEQFLQLLQRGSASASLVSESARPIKYGPILTHTDEASSTSLTHTLPSQPKIQIIEIPAHDPHLDIHNPHRTHQSDRTNLTGIKSQLPKKKSASLSTPVIEILDASLNQLRLELSKEAYVRVFVDDDSGEPSLDDVLPAGSAASWKGHTFYVTIRPANAATFYYNGQRYDYTNRGPENVTLRFP